MSIFIEGRKVLTDEVEVKNENQATYKDILERVKYWEKEFSIIEDDKNDLEEKFKLMNLPECDWFSRSVDYRETLNTYKNLGKMLFLAKAIKAKMEGVYIEPEKYEGRTFHH